jgi:hypothetical protein
VPRISSFYGVDIWMYHDEHGVPHFHANYAEHWASVEIERIRILEGHLPARQMRLVTQWAQLHKEELLDNWLNRGQGPFTPVAPLR